MKYDTLEAHPAAALFPFMADAEMEELEQDIRRNGLIHPIILLDGKILDGRNRWIAVQRAEVKPRFEQWTGTGSPTEWVLSVNLHRRQLTTSQRAAIATNALPMLEAEAEQRKLAALRQNRGTSEAKHQENTDSLKKGSRGKSAEKAAEMANVSRAYVEDAKKIKEQSPETFEQVLNGKKTISEAKAELAPTVAPKPEAPLRERVEKQWLAFMDRHAVCDHAEVKKIVGALINRKEVGI